MCFKFRYKVKVSDLWQASMYYSYSSYLAIINIICIVSSVTLLIKMWATAPVWFKGILVLFVLLFTVIQPAIIWKNSKASLNGNYPEIELTFTSNVIHIEANGEKQDKLWTNVRGIVKKPTLIVLYMEDGNGYILNNRVLGSDRNEFYAFAQDMINKQRS